MGYTNFGTSEFANSIRPFVVTAPFSHNTTRSDCIAGQGHSVFDGAIDRTHQRSHKPFCPPGGSPRQGPPSHKPKRLDGAAAMIPQSRPLIEALAEIPDFRSNRGKRHALAAILALACSAMLWGYRSYPASAAWGRH